MICKRIMSVLVVATMVLSVCVCLTEGSTGDSANEPLRPDGGIAIMEHGVLDEKTIRQWGISDYRYDEDKDMAYITYDDDVEVICDDSFWVKGDNVTLIINGSLKLHGENKTTVEYDGFFLNSLVIKGPGSLELETPGGDRPGNIFKTIYCDDSVTVDNCSLTIVTNNVGPSWGIYAKKNLSIIDSSVTVKTEKDVPCNDGGGVYSSEVTISNSNVTVDMDSTGKVNGIKSPTLTMSDSIVSVDVESSSTNDPTVYGLLSTVKVEIQNCDVVIEAADADSDSSRGIATKDLQINRSNIDIKSGSLLIEGQMTISKEWGSNYQLLDSAKKEVKLDEFVKLTGHGTVLNLKITLSFDLDGGKGTVNDISGKHGDTVELPECKATRNGEVFVCWTDGYQEYEPGESVELKIDVTLKAVYGPDPNPSGGDFTMVAVIIGIAVIPLLAVLGIIFSDRRY